MNKSELIAAVAEKTGMTKKDSEKAVGALLETIKTAVAKKQKVQLIGFGTFEPRVRAARTGKNPKTGATLKIPATTVPKFSAGTAFKAAVAPKKPAAKATKKK